MESKKDLEDKLALYKVQLNQVNDLLLVDSQNPQFLKLRDDLDSVILLTANLIQQVYSNNSINDDAEDDLVDNEKFSIKKQSSYTPKTGVISVGENVEVTGGDRLYAGTVVEVINDSEYKIKYFEFDSIVTLPVTSLQRMDVNNPPALQLEEYEVSVDMQCQSKYALDLKYYDCVVTGVTKNGYNITYTQYGNSEEVPIEYLRNKPADDSAPSAFSSSGVRREGGVKKTNDGLIVIPENLKILPTDTEEEKNRKKKKLKAIKNKNRVTTIENETKEVQQTWQKFVNKGAKRSLTGLVKSSQFASSEAVDGKLGVVNSGKGMTSFADRKKHKFDNLS